MKFKIAVIGAGSAGIQLGWCCNKLTISKIKGK